MKIIDYIHYYFGCQCLEAIKVPGQELNFEPATITVRTLFNVQSQLSEVKLVLRRLEDMTEDEAIAVHRKATKTPFLTADKDEYDVTYIKDNRDVCSIQVVDLRMPKMYTNINIEGDVLVYIHEQNENPKICERVANQNHITHYLLQNHFDVFGLIDAGLAIDAKNITQ